MPATGDVMLAARETEVAEQSRAEQYSYARSLLCLLSDILYRNKGVAPSAALGCGTGDLAATANHKLPSSVLPRACFSSPLFRVRIWKQTLSQV